MIKRGFFTPAALAALGLALCVFSCTSAASVVNTGSDANSVTNSDSGTIHLNDFKWPPWEPLPPEYVALEAQAGPCASRDTAIQLAELKAKLKVAELTAGISIAQSRQFITAYLEESGVTLVNQQEAFGTILSAVEVYISRVEIPRTFSGEYQGQWYAKTRAVFTREWEERETARLEPERGTIQANWKAILEKTAKRMEELNRDALSALKAANAPARESMQEGHDYYNQQRYHDTIAAYSNAVSIWESQRLPPPAEVYEWIGHGHFKLKNYGKAALAYEKALEVDPDSINALRAMREARATEEQRLFDEARRQAAESAASGMRRGPRCSARTGYGARVFPLAVPLPRPGLLAQSGAPLRRSPIRSWNWAAILAW
jgi:tetratricopeptide (TPR) repeat protein